MPGVEKVGVEAIVEGFNKFTSQMAQMEKSYDKLIGSLDRNTSAMRGAGKSAGATTGALAALGAGVAMLAVKFGQTLVQGIGKAKDALVKFASESAHLAGKFQEMEIVALAVGRAMGLTEQEIRDGISTLNDAGIRYDVAAKSVAQLARNQVDLANAYELARIAQATGIIVDEDSSATMERLTWAITTGNTTMLRRMGIMVDNEAMERRYQEEIGATNRVLTQQEKIQARVNGIIEGSAALLPLYAEAMKSPTKALRSLIGRVLPEMKAAFGQFFLPAWKTAIDAVMRWVVAVKAAMQEGGALYRVLTRLGAYAKIAAEAFGWLVDAFVMLFPALGRIDEGLMAWFEVVVSGMAEFGFAMMEALVDGIIAGIDLLIRALNIVGSVLADFLSPGSPPKIAPELDKWGAQAMGEYLHGFTKADFSVLKSIQGPLKQLLSGKDFASISQQLIGGLSGGKVDPGFFDTIKKAAGAFGDEIAELARRELALADALRAVDDAEKRIQETRKAVENAQLGIAKATQEYNALLRGGASDRVLDAKLAEINAAEEGLTVAQRQAAEAEKAKETAEAQIGVLREELQLQRDLVEQLLMLNQAQEGAASKAEKTAKGIKGMAGAMKEFSAAIPDASDFDIASGMGAAVEAMAADMKKKIAAAFKPLQTKLGELQKKVEKLKLAWTTFKETVVDVWEAIKLKVEEVKLNLEQWLGMDIPTSIDELKTALQMVLFRALVVVWQYLTTTFIPKLIVLRDKFKEIKDKIWEAAQTLRDELIEAFKSFRDIIKDDILPLLDPTKEGSLSKVFIWFKNSVLIPLKNAFDKLAYWAGMFYNTLKAIKDLLDNISIPPWAQGHSPPPLADSFGYIADQVSRLATVEIPKLQAAFGGLTPALAMGGLAPALPGGGMSQVTTTNSYSVGPNYISQPIDLAALEATVERVVMRAARGY